MALTPIRHLLAGGMEVPAVTARVMREIDRIAVEETGPNLFQMMENAGVSPLGDRYRIPLTLTENPH